MARNWLGGGTIAFMKTDPLALALARQFTSTGEARAIRLRARLSLTEVASTCGVDQSTVHRWENGRRVPRGAPAARYAGLLVALAALSEAAS